MIRLALILCLLTFIGYGNLPKWRARFTGPIHQRCLKITPEAHHKTEIQSLVCGTPLRNSSNPSAWRNLGLIHILVVSGGHLSILALVLVHSLRLMRLPETSIRLLSGTLLVLFSLANQLQPPVLRALFDWVFRRHLKSRGWRSTEVALISTWVALPFSSSIYDLLSLALSFFASVTVENAMRALQRQTALAAIGLQTAVWWILLPLLFTMGVPHPLTSMVNILLAPILGATLIPFAMLTWATGLLPPISGYEKDPLLFGFFFDFIWEKLSIAVDWLANVLPGSSPRLVGVKPLVFGLESSIVMLLMVFAATCALLIRSRRTARRENAKRSWIGPALFILFAFLLAIAIHRELGSR